MHALRHVHELVVPGGTVVDVHPVTEQQVETGAGEVIGVIEEPEFTATDLPNAETRLREAIRDLRRAGYVESRRGRLGGTFVRYRPVEITAPPADALRRARELTGSLEDVLALRRVLELGATELAARRRLSERERAYLRERLSDCASRPAGGYRQRDSRLHLALAELSGSVSLAAAVADARVRLNDLLDAIPLLPRNIRHSDAQHATVVAAVLAGDPARARQAMEEHVDGTAALLRGFLG